MRLNKVEQVAAFLQEKIRREGLAPGTRLDSVRELAKKLEISPLTASRAVTKLVREGWLRTRQGQGCFVAAGADGTEAGPGSPGGKPVPPQRTVGALLHMRWSTGAPLPASFSQALERIQARFFSEQLNVLSTPAVLEPFAKEPFVPLAGLVAQNLNALITLGIGNLEFLGRLRVLGYPVVASDVNACALGLDCVYFDHSGSAGKLVRLLHKKGARRVGFVGGPLALAKEGGAYYFDPCAPDRLEGWRAASLALGLPATDTQVFDVTRRGGALNMPALRKYLSGPDAPDALLTEFPAAILAALEQPGFPKVPVAGWMGSEEEPDLRGKLACGAVCDFRMLGDATATLLLERLKSRADHPKAIRIETKIE